MTHFMTAFLLILMLCLSNSASATEEYWEYTFRPGDSIWKIAKQHTTSVDNWREIQKINLIRHGLNRNIPIGTRIIIPISMLKDQPIPAKVIALMGKAYLIQANGNKTELNIGKLLYSGDRVITGDNQILSIQFADQSQLQVLPNSDIVIDKLSHHKNSGMVDTQIRLNSGRINTQVEKQKRGSRYEISTPVAITAVRGTSFRKSYDNNSISRTEVTEGLVNVTSGLSKKEVKEGYGIIAEKGKPLADPIKLLEPPVLSVNLSSNNSIMKASWNTLKGAKHYRYQLALDDKFNQLVANNTIQDNKVEIKELQPAHYYLRVRGIDKHQFEGINSINDFIVNESPSKDESIKNVILPAQIFMINL